MRYQHTHTHAPFPPFLNFRFCQASPSCMEWKEVERFSSLAPNPHTPLSLIKLEIWKGKENLCQFLGCFLLGEKNELLYLVDFPISHSQCPFPMVYGVHVEKWFYLTLVVGVGRAAICVGKHGESDLREKNIIWWGIKEVFCRGIVWLGEALFSNAKNRLDFLPSHPFPKRRACYLNPLKIAKKNH